IATDLHTSNGVIFLSGAQELPTWTRRRWRIERTTIGVEHLLASSAIPIFFPSVAIGGSYYGDGSIRNTAPLSPAIHLGARRILAIGGRELLPSPPASTPLEEEDAGYPSPAKITGVLFDSIFLDALEIDREQMARIN